MRMERLGAVVACATILAGCGGSGTGPDATPVVTTVEVTLTSALVTGDTAVAAAVVKDQNGNVMAGKTVTWSTSAGAVASVSTGGVVTAGQAGTSQISASVDGKTGSGTVTVAADDRFGYTWANDQSSASYTVTNGYVHSSSGGAVNIVRSATGVYAVTFVGLGATGAQRTNVQVSAYSTGSAHCKTAGWHNSGADLVVDVKCFSSAGTATDARYTVLATGATALQGRLGFGYVDNATAAASTPAQARSSRGKGIRAARTGTGVYSVTFDGLARLGTDTPEQIMVTSVGDTGDRCTVDGWDFTTFELDVRCVNSAGANTDSKFSVLLIEKARSGRKLAFAWANDPASASYAPSVTYNLNDGGGATLITRTDAGSYTVTFTGLARTAGAVETVLVAAYGGTAMCRIGSWGGSFSVSVQCYDATGVAADSRFDIIVVQ